MGPERELKAPGDNKSILLFVQSQPGIEHPWFLFSRRASGLAKTLLLFRNLRPSWPCSHSPSTFRNVLSFTFKSVLHVQRHSDWSQLASVSQTFIVSSAKFYAKRSVCVLIHVWLFAIPWTVVLGAPLSMGFFRQIYWYVQPFFSPGKLSNPGIKSISTCISCISRWILYHWATWESHAKKKGQHKRINKVWFALSRQWG